MVERYSKSIARRSLGTLPKVTPKDAKVNNYEAQAWGQVAQTGNALYRQFGQYARDNARTQAIDDAEGVTLEKDSTGLTIMPPPMQEGGSIYQENYKRIIGDIYKREIKTDIETNLSKIFAENFLNPVEMGEQLDNSLGSIVANIAPQYQQEMGSAGQRMITAYKQRSTQEATRRTFNANIQGLKEEASNITQELIYNNLTDIERNEKVNRAVEIDLNLSLAGILSPIEIESRKKARTYYENFFNLKDLLEVRSPSETADLLNDPSQYIAIAQLLEGNEGGANNVGVTLTDGLKDYKFTRDSIEDLIGDPVLRKKIALHFRQRANDIIDKSTATKFDEGVLKQLGLWGENYTGRSSSASITDAMVEGAHEKAITSMFEQDRYKGKFKVATIAQDLAKATTFEAVEVMTNLIGWIEKTEDFPQFLLNEIKNINMASGAELANFHYPFYQQMKGTDELLEIWDENVDVNTQRYFKKLDLLVEASSNPRDNKITFEEAANLMKVSNNEPIIDKIKSMISTNLRKNDDSYATGMSLEGSNKGLMLRYIDHFHDVGGLKLDSSMQYDKEMQAQLYRHALQYISKGSKHDLNDLNDDLVKVAEKVMDSRTDPEEMTGSYSKKKFESLLYTKDISKAVPTPFNKAIETQASSVVAFQGKEKYAVLNNLVTTQVQAVINSQPYGDVNIEVLNDSFNTKTPAEMFKDGVIGSNSSQFRINPNNPNAKIKGKLISQGFAIDGPLVVTREMYQPFTLDYKNEEMIMIYGKTYKLHYDDNSQEIYVVLIDDEGDFKTINGFLEVDGKPLAIDVDSYLAQNVQDNQAIERKNALKKIEENLQVDAVKIKNLKDLDEGKVEKGGYLRSEPQLTKGVPQYLWSKFKEFYGGDKPNYEQQERIINYQLKDVQDAIKKEEDSIDFDATLEDKLEKKLEISKDQKRSPLITNNGVGNNIVRDVSVVVADMLPSDNQENIVKYLREIAKVESNYGIHPDTYVGENKDMGIWQNYKALTNIQYLITSNKGGQFAENIKTIERHMQQNYKPFFEVANLTKEDLKSPIVSAVIARLYIALTEKPIPDTVEGRAEYWKEHYNTVNGKGTIEDYINKNSILVVE